MLKMHRMPDVDLNPVTVYSVAGLPEMRVFVSSKKPHRHYVYSEHGIYDRWWKVAAIEVSEENLSKTYAKAMMYFGIFLEGGENE